MSYFAQSKPSALLEVVDMVVWPFSKTKQKRLDAENAEKVTDEIRSELDKVRADLLHKTVTVITVKKGDDDG